MSDIPTDLGYRESHEWVRASGDGTAVVGISDHAQSALGDMVYVELPEAGLSFEQGDACAVVESVKAASDIYAPVSGEVIEFNGALPRLFCVRNGRRELACATSLLPALLHRLERQCSLAHC